MPIEIVVRPAVMPDIRPKSFARQVTADDPNANKYTSTGSGGQVLDLNYNLNISISKQKGRESQRTFDIARIYRVVPATSTPAVAAQAIEIDRETYIDVEIPHKITLQQGGDKGSTIKRIYRKPKAGDYPNGNIEIIEQDLIRKNPREQ